MKSTQPEIAYMKALYIPCLLILVTSCTTDFTGPITGIKYKVEAGCTSDMEHYKEEREQVLKDEDADHKDIECPVEDDTGHPY